MGEGLKGLEIVNYADGTHGSYCIARTLSEKYTEYWNPDGWKAFGYVFKDKQLAEAMVAALEAAAPAGTAPQFNKEEINVLVQGFAGDTGWLTNHLNRLIEVKRADRPSRTSVSSGDASMSAAALATPSPQAPQTCICGHPAVRQAPPRCERWPKCYLDFSGPTEQDIVNLCPPQATQPAGSLHVGRAERITDDLDEKIAEAGQQQIPDSVSNWLRQEITSALKDAGSPRKVGEEGALREALERWLKLSESLPCTSQTWDLSKNPAVLSSLHPDCACTGCIFRREIAAALSLSSPIEPARLTEIREAVREECCKAICGCCAHPEWGWLPAHWEEGWDMWAHGHSKNGGKVGSRCDASAIRALAPSRQGAG